MQFSVSINSLYYIDSVCSISSCELFILFAFFMYLPFYLLSVIFCKKFRIVTLSLI